MPESYKPTAAMIAAAKRGLALREKYKRGGLDASQAKAEGVGSGVARARDIINGNLSLQTVKRMNAFFSRHEKNYRPDVKESDGGPTPGTVAWLLWGGSSGKAWAKSILAKQDIKKSVSESDIADLYKAVDAENHHVTFVCMIPGESDAHDEGTDAEEIRKACINFNKSKTKSANLFHMFNTNTFDIVESYTLPTELTMQDANGDIRYLPKGTWLTTLEVTDLNIWNGILSGEYNGVSIGARGRKETIEE